MPTDVEDATVAATESAGSGPAGAGSTKGAAGPAAGLAVGPTPSRRRELAVWLGAGVVAAGLLVGAVMAMGGRLEAATWGLVVAAGAMVFALHSLYRMATALSRPAVEAAIDQHDVAAYAGVRELREERRRLLRAINELQFDYEMGKLSDEDYDKVRQGYELQAVEVIRALDAESTLHPRLQEELRRRGLLQDDADDRATADAVEKKAAASEAKPEPSEAKATPEPTPEAKATPEPGAASDEEAHA